MDSTVGREAKSTVMEGLLWLLCKDVLFSCVVDEGSLEVSSVWFEHELLLVLLAAAESGDV